MRDFLCKTGVELPTWRIPSGRATRQAKAPLLIPRIVTNPKLILNKTMTNGDVDSELMATTTTSIMHAYPLPLSHL